MEASLRYKEEGNRSFSAKDFISAITSYRHGLSTLPPPDINDDNRNKCEVALRSNLALCLIRSAEDPKHKTSDGQIRDCLTAAERECSAALELEPDNPKLWYRRGQSKILIFQFDDKNGNNAALKSADDLSCDQLLLAHAEVDIKQCEQLLHAQLDTSKHNTTASNATKRVISQIIEARKALKRIESERLRTGGDGIKSIPSQQSESDSDEHSELKNQRRKSLYIPKSGLIAQLRTSRSSRSTNSQTANGSSTTGANCDSSIPPPSPSEQKEQILQLLLRRQYSQINQGMSNDSKSQTNQTIYPPQKGEAYFLIDMAWWEKWCHYVHFFHMYKNIEEEDNISLKRRVCQIDIENARILEYLPPGATIPPYLEKEKKAVLCKNEKRKTSDSSSSSSEESSDDSDIGELLAPTTIDNSSLILNQDGCWYLRSIYLAHLNRKNGTYHENFETQFLLKSHLVRGHHFEILPREAYAALRSWYGEQSTPIMRRVQSIEELPWLFKDYRNKSNMSVKLALYADRWQAIQQPHEVNNNLTNSYVCCACRAPYAKSKCTKCRCARYCNKDCQKSHWTYHKAHCWSLMKQKFQNEEIAAKNALVPEMTVWGRVGLNNLGNTCFMSSAIQCMSHVTPLTRLFLSNLFLENLNEKNINGTGGKVANAYAALMKNLWMGGNQHRTFSPTVLKRAIEHFAPQFYGGQQQDSAEFLSYLLDALHEDLNRIRNPPYVEMPEPRLGRKLTVCGAETWDALCLRNSSYVFETFYGLYKSTCVCPKCEIVSVTFDTFNHITLEIPRISKLDFQIVLYRDHGKEKAKLPIKYCISVPQTGTIGDLIAVLSSTSGVLASRLKICNVVIDRCTITQLYRDDISVSSLTNEELLVAYEIASFDDKTKINALIQHKTQSTVFGLPLLVSFERGVRCIDAYNKLWEYVTPFVMLGHEESDVDMNSFLDRVKNQLRIHVTDSEHKNARMLRTGFDSERTSYLPSTNDKVADLMGLKDKEKFVFFSIEYPDVITNTDINFDKKSHIYTGNFLMVTNHSSIAEYKNRVNRMHESSSVTLDQCFESFTQPERLDDKNKWYCSKCKEHVKAMKTVELWRLPNVLVIHLKRFEYRNSFDRNKIGTLVEFPVDGLDMKKHSAYNSSASADQHSRSELVDEETPQKYDLFGVINHYGRMGYGHYTAYTRRFSEFGIENSWAEFDDENVIEVEENGIVSPSAYVLFYRRRTFL